jgi:ech hydrogenase subunit D
MVEIETQSIDVIEVDDLLSQVDALKLDGWRLVQILCISLEDGYELNYSFGGGYAMRTLRLTIGLKDAVPSITPHYGAAFLYENEIRDLFGVRLERIDLDWRGKVFDVKGDKPFSKVSMRLASSERQSPPPAAGKPDAAGGAKP